ncbi:mannosyltransferase [Flaviaesturariibacter flavus]|uniref:Mannosyltransferase n=1 Tax=Flaviaesturariibacter flavus TaxID=2502780 RepID=A0A4R1BP09_9BACT|nr:mannosyltransferase [Flaviaesturariibacter flavus]TCJ19241.1 mannosyltransferase [Flaviaesturariibacter flavus]
MPGKLHIVCLDAPAPPDYGGAIDMFYKVKALAESGRSIELHYFAYRSGRNAEALAPYCTAIHAYPRKSFLASLWQKQPYIVGSRNSSELRKRLETDDAPLLLEGIHCTGLLSHFYGKRKVLVRMHNDEAAYYAGLAANEPNPLRKAYFFLEGRLLQAYQHGLPKELPLACVAKNDIETLEARYGFTNLPFVPSFTPWQELSGPAGRGDFCLYHGNMEVSENVEAASWLIRNVFQELPLPFVVAGKNIPPSLLALKGRADVRFVSNPEEIVLNELVREAQVHVLPSFNTTGLKLKMLHALFEGRHCLTNRAGIAGTSFAGAVELAENAAEFKAALLRLWEQPFTGELRERRRIVADVYNNRFNATALNAWL